MNKLHLNRRSGFGVKVLIGLMLSAAVATVGVAKDDELPEVSSDGLHLIEGTKVRIAYATPDLDLGQYDKVMLLDCFVQFMEDWKRDYNLHEVGLSGRVDDRDMEQIKQRLADEFKAVFTEELTEGGHEVVDEEGPGVLLLRPAIINLDVTAPDIMSAGRSNTWVQSAGQMTLYMELYDSATNKLLARVVDPQADRSRQAKMASRTRNASEARKILRKWANLLGSHLGDVKATTGAGD